MKYYWILDDERCPDIVSNILVDENCDEVLFVLSWTAELSPNWGPYINGMYCMTNYNIFKMLAYDSTNFSNIQLYDDSYAGYIDSWRDEFKSYLKDPSIDEPLYISFIGEFDSIKDLVIALMDNEVLVGIDNEQLELWAKLQ